MIISNEIAGIETKKQAYEFARKMTKQVLHEGAGLTWIRTTQSFLSGAILYVKDKYKEKARLSDVREFVLQSEEKEGFLEHITDHLEKDHPSYHAFSIMLTCKESTRILVIALSNLCMRTVKE